MTDTLAATLADDLDLGFERLVSLHAGRVYGVALGVLGSRQDAEEVAQDALLRAHRALRSYPRERIRALRVAPWLCTITLNAARNRLRTRRPAEPITGREAADGRGGPEAVALRRAEGVRLQQGLLTLTPAHREAVVLRCVRGLGYAEAAQVLGRPVGTVKADVHRGLARLRRHLEDEPGDRVRTEIGA